MIYYNHLRNWELTTVYVDVLRSFFLKLMFYFKDHSNTGLTSMYALVFYQVNLSNKHLTAHITALWALPNM